MVPDHLVRNIQLIGEFQKGKIEAEKEINDMKKTIAEPVNEIKNTAAEIKKS